MKKKTKLIIASITVIIAVIVIASLICFNGDNGDKLVGTWMADAKTFYTIKKKNNGYELITTYENLVESQLKGDYISDKEVMTFEDTKDGWTHEFKIDSETGDLLHRIHFKSSNDYSKTYRVRKVSSDDW